MNPTVLGSIIGAAGALVVCLINNFFTNRKRKDDEEKKEEARRKEELEKEKQRAALEAAKEERLASRLNAIEKKQEEVSHKLDIHNGYAEKIGAVQQDIAYIKGKLEKGD